MVHSMASPTHGSIIGNIRRICNKLQLPTSGPRQQFNVGPGFSPFLFYKLLPSMCTFPLTHSPNLFQPSIVSHCFALIIPAIRSKLFPSGCRSIYSSWPSLPDEDEKYGLVRPLRSGTVRNNPWSSVIPVIRTEVGIVVVVSVTN